MNQNNHYPLAGHHGDCDKVVKLTLYGKNPDDVNCTCDQDRGHLGGATIEESPVVQYGMAVSDGDQDECC